MEFKNPTNVLKKIFHHSILNTIVPGTLTVSCYANFYPICYMKKNQVKGLDIDIMKEFAKRCKLKIKFIIKPNFNDIWFDPVRNISDVAVGGIGMSTARTRADTEWTIPYFYVKRTIIYNKSNPIVNFPEDVNNTIVSAKGSIGWLDGIQKLGSKVKFLKEEKNDKQDIRDLLDGKIQGMLRGSFVGVSILKKYPQLDMLTPWNAVPEVNTSKKEVFAYPCNVRSRIGILLSVFITEEIMNSDLLHLVQKYDLV
jgi:ABC-type amino acid transport substrate-binding protein